MNKEHEPIINLVKGKENLFLKCKRINFRGQRIYVFDNPKKIYSGLTGAIEKTQFKSEGSHIKTWRENLIDLTSKEFVNSYVETTANFGTRVHECLVTIKEEGEIDFDYEGKIAEENFRDQMLQNNIHYDIIDTILPKMVEEFKFHLASLMQFVYERVTEIIAIETICKWEEHQVATPVDMYCMCKQTPEGKPKKSVINVKTSNKITSHHLDQVACELSMWNETYKDFEAEHCGILRTKVYKGENPTYDYKYQTIEESLLRSDFVSRKLKLSTFRKETDYRPKTEYTFLSGKIKLGETPIKNVKNI